MHQTGNKWVPFSSQSDELRESLPPQVHTVEDTRGIVDSTGVETVEAFAAIRAAGVRVHEVRGLEVRSVYSPEAVILFIREGLSVSEREAVAFDVMAAVTRELACLRS